MKRLPIIIVSLMVSLGLYGQVPNSIAVVVTSSDVNKTELHLIEDDFQKELLNASENSYDIRIGKSDEFFAERNSELKFQHSGAVDENHIKEYGKTMGVDQLCVIVVERRQANDYYFRAKIYDVETGRLRKTASYPDSFEGDLPLRDITDYSAVQRADRYLIGRIGILDSNRQQRWEEKLKTYDIQKDKDKKDRKDKANRKALAASVVPGLGLIQKGHKVEGTTYLVGDIVLVGCGVGSLLYANNQQKVMNSPTSDYSTYASAEKNYKSARTAGFICLGTAVALYLTSFVRSYVAEPIPGAKIQWGLAPVNVGYPNDMNFGVGVSLAYNF